VPTTHQPVASFVTMVGATSTNSGLARLDRFCSPHQPVQVGARPAFTVKSSFVVSSTPGPRRKARANHRSRRVSHRHGMPHLVDDRVWGLVRGVAAFMRATAGLGPWTRGLSGTIAGAQLFPHTSCRKAVSSSGTSSEVRSPRVYVAGRHTRASHRFGFGRARPARTGSSQVTQRNSLPRTLRISAEHDTAGDRGRRGHDMERGRRIAPAPSARRVLVPGRPREDALPCWRTRRWRAHRPVRNVGAVPCASAGMPGHGTGDSPAEGVGRGQVRSSAVGASALNASVAVRRVDRSPGRANPVASEMKRR